MDANDMGQTSVAGARPEGSTAEAELAKARPVEAKPGLGASVWAEFQPPVQSGWNRPLGLGDVGRLLVTHNPFYLLSAALVLYGLAQGFETSDIWINTGVPLAILLGYTFAMAGAAVTIVRAGRVWDDARTILMALALLTVALTTGLDEIILRETPHAPWAAVAVLLAVLGIFAGVWRGLGIVLPPSLMLPGVVLLVCLFLYPLLPAEFVLRGRQTAATWSILGFPVLCSAVFLGLIPAIRRGPGFGRANGTPWPSFAWVLYGVLGASVCARAYFLGIAFYPGAGVGGFHKLECAFGLYCLVPLYLTLMWLLLEFGLSCQNEWLQRLALCGAWLGIWLALPGTDGSAGYREVRQLLVGTLGSPAFLTAFAVMLMALLAMACGVRRSELALVASALAGVVIGPQTLSLTTLASPRAMPLLLLAIALTWTALVRRHLAWCLLAAVGYVLSLTAALRGTWFAAGHGAVPLHLTLGAVLALGAVGAGRFASFLRGVGAVALGALPAVVLFGHTRIDPAAPELLAWAYAAVMGAVALALWLLQRDRRYLWAALVVALAAGLRGTATMARSLGEVQFRGGVPLAHGLFYFVVALVISLAKGGVLQRLADRLTAGRQTAHGGSRQES